MTYAIIAAGEGSRLAAEGIAEPKPLIDVGGERMVDRLIRIFMANDATDIVCICNDRTPLVADHLALLQRDGLGGCPVPLHFEVRTTPSSMHSLHVIGRHLADAPFILTTVDTVFDEREFAAYVQAFRQTEADALMGVTDYIDDERPLYVQTDAALRITAYPEPPTDCRYISAGIYALRPSALATLDRCVARGESRMRNFQRALLAEGHDLRAWPLTHVFDIDHAADLDKARRLLASPTPFATPL